MDGRGPIGPGIIDFPRLTSPDDEAPVTGIDKARTSGQEAIRGLLAIADCAEPTAAASAEPRLWSGLLVLGRALMALFFARQAARWRVGQSYDVDGRRFAVVGTETAEVDTRFGKVAWPMGSTDNRSPRSIHDAHGGGGARWRAGPPSTCSRRSAAPAHGHRRNLP
jgi:hypothetical protein